MAHEHLPFGTTVVNESSHTGPEIGDLRRLVRRTRNALQVRILSRLSTLDAWCRRLKPRRGGTKRRIDGGAGGDTGKLCVFSHFDRDGKVDDYVIHYATQLCRLGFGIIFVSTADDLDDDGVSRLQPLCREIVVRDNVGYDFGSWKAGLELAGNLEGVETLILANDSVYGPVHDLAPVFATMRDRGLDVWGITDSWQLRYHLQSYFMVFEKAALQSPAFQNFWKSLPAFCFKRVLIWRCEVGLSQGLIKAGLALGALCEYGRLRREHRATVLETEDRSFTAGPLNSTHSLWNLLLSELDCPFLKVGLLRDNPENLTDLHQWQGVLAATSEYDPHLIRRHLARMNDAWPDK